jgi:hypothetical protein
MPEIVVGLRAALEKCKMTFELHRVIDSPDGLGRVVVSLTGLHESLDMVRAALASLSEAEAGAKLLTAIFDEHGELIGASKPYPGLENVFTRVLVLPSPAAEKKDAASAAMEE